jgi:hypothetical protein
MGKFEQYGRGYWINGLFFETYKKMDKYCKENNIEKVNTSKNYYWTRYEYEYEHDYGPIGKKHCFYYTYKDYKGNEHGCFEWRSTISQWLIGIADDKCNDNYAEYFDLLERQTSYSMPDYNHITYHAESFEEFDKRIKCSSYYPYSTVYFHACLGDKIERFKIVPKSPHSNEYVLYKCKPDNNLAEEEVIDMFPTTSIEVQERYWPYKTYTEQHMIPVTFEEIYNRMNPMYKQTYLTNGKEYIKEY